MDIMSGATIVINILNHTSKKFVDGAKFALNLQFPLITQKGLVLNFVPVLMLPCIYWLHDMPCVAIFTFFVLPNIAVWLHGSLISFVKMIIDFFQRRLHKAFDVIDHQILGNDDSRLNWNNHISSTAWRIYLKLNRAWDFKFSAVSSGILALKNLVSLLEN